MLSAKSDPGAATASRNSTRIESAQQHLAAGRKEIQDLADDRTRVQTHAANVERELGAVRLQVADLQQRLAVEQKTANDLTTERARFTDRIAELERQLEDVQQRLGSEQAAGRSASTARDQATAQVSELEQAVTRLKGEHSTLTGRWPTPRATQHSTRSRRAPPPASY